MTQEEVFLGEGLEAPPLECIGPNVGHAPLYFPFVLRRPGATRDDVHAVVPAEVGQLWIDLRIKPIGLQHRRFHIVEVQQERRTTQISETVFQAAQERLGVLPGDRLAVALARIAQYHPQDPTTAPLTLAVIDRAPKPKSSWSSSPGWHSKRQTRSGWASRSLRTKRFTD